MIFVFDWDGTLGGHESSLSESSERALKYLSENGHTIIIATGRSPYDVLEKIGSGKKYISRYVIGSNGGSILDWKTNTIVYESYLSNEVAKQAIDYAKAHKVQFGIIADNHTYYYDSCDDLPVENDIPKESRTCGVFTEKDFNKFSNKISLIGMTFNNNLDQNFKNISNSIKDANVHFADQVWLQVIPKDVSKFAGIQFVISKLKLHGEKIIAFGDSGNDLSMIKGADIGVVMGDAKDEIKNQGNVVIDTAANNGIEKYILKNY